MVLKNVKFIIVLLIRNPAYYSINIFGIIIGFLTFFCLWQYSDYYLTGHQSIKDADNIYRYAIKWSWDEGPHNRGFSFYGSQSGYLGYNILQDNPQINDMTRTCPIGMPGGNDLWGFDKQITGAVLSDNATTIGPFIEENVIYADPNIFDFFGVPLIYGSPSGVLSKPNSVALSKAIATKYFGNDDPTGEWITFNNQGFEIGGVFDDLEKNTPLYFDIVFSNTSGLNQINSFGSNWDWVSWQTYFKIPSKKEKENVLVSVKNKKSEYYDFVLKLFPHSKVEEVYLQPFKDIIFTKPYINDSYNQITKSTLHLMKIAAVVILFMAWANYFNLTYSRVLKRIKEIGTRKVFGISKGGIFGLFLTESLLINTSAAFLTMVLVQSGSQLLSSLFNTSAGLFAITGFSDISIYLYAWGLSILIMALYPTVLSSKKSMFAFSSNAGAFSKSSLHWRKVVTTIQYAASFTLLSWTLFAYQQLHAIYEAKLGFEKNDIIVVEGPIIKPYNYIEKVDQFIAELHAKQFITQGTFSASVPGDYSLNEKSTRLVRKGGAEKSAGPDSNGGVDEHFIPFFDIKLMKGRNFSGTPSDNNAVVVSEQCARRLGFEDPREVVGAKLILYGKEVEVIGLVQDYRIRPFLPTETNWEKNGASHNTELGIALTYRANFREEEDINKISLKLPTKQNLPNNLDAVKNIYDKYFPNNVFNWYFLDKKIQRSYIVQSKRKDQLFAISLVAIFISAIGLIGITRINLVNRRKEIAIRKVLGANFKKLGLMVTLPTFIMLGASFLLATPVVYYLLSSQVSSYSIPFNFGLMDFLTPAIIFTVTLFATIFYTLTQSLIENPTEALKRE